MSNFHLNRAKTFINDEFYTYEKDIEKELINYKELFINKKIICPCDDKNSNFISFLNNKKDEWKISKIDYSKTYENCNYENYDIVITNPPFSKFNKFFDLITNNKKLKFIIVAPLTVLSKRNIVELFICNKIDTGFNSISKFYDYKDNIQDSPAIWLTNLIIGSKNYINEEPKLCDNYNILYVSKINLIPKNYIGIMAVPITFLKNWDRKKFELIGSSEYMYKDIKINNKKPFKKIFIKWKVSNTNEK